MAQSGYTPILIYASGTTGNAPSAANLTSSASGAELALNYFDGKLYYKDASGNVQVLATKGAAQNSISFGTTGLTPSTATQGAVTVAGTLITSNGGTGLSSWTAGDLPYYASGTALSKLGIGTNGQILTSSGTAPQWTTLSGVAVTTFSAGTTGFTPSSATSGAVTLAGTLATTNGGTGLTSFTANGLLYATSTSALTTGSALTFDGSVLKVQNTSPFMTVRASSGGSAILELVSAGNWNWNIRGTATEQSFWRDSVNYWYWNSTNIVSSLNIIPSANSTYSLGSSGGIWNNLYMNYIKATGGATYTSVPIIDVYPSTNDLRIFHSGTPASDLNIGAAGSAAGGLITESNAYQATFSNGPGFLFSTAITGGKLLSLTGSGVGIGKNSAAYSLDIAPASTSDGLMVRRPSSSATAFFVNGDGTVQWGNGTTDYGQLSWNTGYAIVGAKGSLYLTTNGGVSTVNALILGTSGAATFASNISYPNGSYVSSGTFGRLWVPGQVIGSGYGGLYGQALTYNADYNSGWKSLGGGTATAITIDEGCFQLSKSNSVGVAGAALTWSPVIGTNGQGVGIGRYTPSSLTDLSITQNSTYGIGIDNTAGTQNYSWRIDSTNSNAWTFGTRTTSLDLYYVLPGGNAVYTQTGALRVHNGTTAQRPTASAGSIRWNTSIPQLEVGDGTQFQKIVTEAIVTATGGTVTTDGDYKIHTFTTSGTFTISAIAGAVNAAIQVLVVAGGGGGGFYLGGGGGSGAVFEGVINLAAGSYTVTVGAGGTSTSAATGYSSNGGLSSISGSGLSDTQAYAKGGGAGSNGTTDAYGANGNGGSGGSGGGGASPYGFTFSNGTVVAQLGGPAGINGSGGAHGSIYSSLTFTGGGGGGGALTSGVMPNVGNGPVGLGGYGGSGRSSLISGSNVYYGGGGAGGYGTYLANLQISGGAGGGGAGVGTAGSGANLQATAGSANTGGGGGGGQAFSGYERGGSGGSGVVIIRYKYQ